MIEARLATTDKEVEDICAAMPILGSKNALCMYGYWNGNKYVGGSYLIGHYPYEFVYEYSAKFEDIVDALGESLLGMLSVKPQVIARVTKDNYKSLKRLKTLGFVKLYTDDTHVVFQFNKENWRHKKRYPLD